MAISLEPALTQLTSLILWIQKSIMLEIISSCSKMWRFWCGTGKLTLVSIVVGDHWLRSLDFGMNSKARSRCSSCMQTEPWLIREQSLCSGTHSRNNPCWQLATSGKQLLLLLAFKQAYWWDFGVIDAIKSSINQGAFGFVKASTVCHYCWLSHLAIRTVVICWQIASSPCSYFFWLIFAEFA